MILLVLLHCPLWADSLVLMNDSNYRLNAIIEDAAGNVLEETVINPQDSSTWSLDYEYFGYDAEENNPPGPYTVYWYCMRGQLYGTCRDVPADSTVLAQSCLGGQQCSQGQ